MSRPYKKLLAASLLAIISISMMVTATYAWFSLAGSPSLSGVQINIGGDNTIMIAPDLQQIVNGQTVHYPGKFDKTMDITKEKSYAYLQKLTGLSPVSTADGIHWFVPKTDENGAPVIADLSDFYLDNRLEYANTTGAEGGYVYIDFWVVSPMDDCTLRISIGEDGGGSYLIQLPEPIADEESPSGYRLDTEPGTIASCARVGFLVNDRQITDNLSMETYINSDTYRDTYKSLRGIYREPGEEENTEEYSFLIYEPNGVVHSEEGIAYIQDQNGLTVGTCEDGSYAVTRPIAYENGERVLKSVMNILQVQKQNVWQQTADGILFIEQLFQASMMNQDTSGWSRQDFMEYFYGEYLQEQFSEFVIPGQFFADTALLYYAGNLNKTPKSQLETLALSNAVERAQIVTLEKNVPQRIRMYVWLEGQDIDCDSSVALEYFTLGIELAGSTED